MHIGIIAPEFPPDIGGVETYSCELAGELARRKHNVTVFTIPHSEGEVTLEGIEVVPILRRRKRLDKTIVSAFPVDVWHATNAAYAWLALETKNVVVSVHGDDFLLPYVGVGRPDLYRIPGPWRHAKKLNALDTLIGRSLTQRLVAQTLPRVSHIFTNSRYTEAVLLEKYPDCRRITSVGLVGVSADFFDAEPIARAHGKPRKLLTVCRLSEERKNVHIVLRALAKLKARYEFDYTVVGDGKLKPQLEALARNLNLQTRVRFVGRLPKASLRQQLTASDLFVLTSSVLPTSHEGFGIVYLEANACGTPVLAARLAGAVEAVAEGVSGMFVDEPTVDSVAAALQAFFSQEVTFDPAACRAFASQFTWAKVVDHVLGYYPVRA